MKSDSIKPVHIKWMLALFIIVGLIVRVMGAWELRITTDPDTSVVALMAKHMALGLDYPCFFYGQLYMGSFEPAVSALLCKLFGFSGFMVNMGTALISVLLLPIMYVWGRDAGGPVAGLAAAAFCIIGSPVFLQYQFNPRGGYASVIMLGALVLWMAARIASRREQDYRSQCFLLGLVSGLAWWVDPLIVMALVAACLVLLAGLRLDALKPGVWLSGLAGFFLGGSPFWLWNAQHDWVGVRALMKSERRVFSEGMLDYATRAQRATGLQDLSPVLWWLMLSVFAVAALVALWRFTIAVKNRRADISVMSTFAAIVMIVSVFLIFSNSTFSRENTARYLLPMVPAVAVVMGILVATCARRHLALAIAPITVTVLMQFHSPQLYMVNKDFVTAIRDMVPKLEDVLSAHEIKTVYVSFAQYPLNVHTDEDFIFPLLVKERCTFMVEKAERDPSPAYLDSITELQHFIETAGGTCERIDLSTAIVMHQLRPPPITWKPIPCDQMVTCSLSGEDVNIRDIIDGRTGTFLYFRREPDKKTWAEVRFKSPLDICGMRFSCAEKRLTPNIWNIEGQLEDGTWTMVMPDKLVSGFFWSGPRAYMNGRFVRYDAKFETVKLIGLRIVFPPGHQPPRWSISELSVFEPSAESLAETEEHTDALMTLLEQRHITNVYADRWMANVIWNRSSERIMTTHEIPTYSGEPEKTRPLIDWSKGSALLVRKDGIDITRDILKNEGISASETDVGPWILLEDFHGSSTNIEWAGFSALLR